MHHDHYFTIGTRHAKEGTPCEDYALSGVLPDGRQYGVVSDGCSGANARTDIGSRVWTNAYARALTQAFPHSREFLERFLQFGRETRFTENAFDYLATVVGVVSDSVTATTTVFGDGVVTLIYRDGLRRMLAVDWRENMPYYPLYAEVPKFDQDFRAMHARAPLLQPVRIRTVDFRADEAGLEVLSDTSAWHDLEVFEHGWVQTYNLAEEGLQGVVVTTDGVEQVQLAGALNQPPEKVMEAFTSFKNHQGGFVKRRVMRALAEFAKTGYLPADDVGVAGLWFD